MILLHGLFGGLSNWSGVVKHFESRFDIYIPELPLYEEYEADTVEYLVDYLGLMIESGKMNQVVLVGNSLGGHIAIRYTHRYPDRVDKLVLTGSSGLYENIQVANYVKRSNYSYIKERVAATFYDPDIATDGLIAEVMQVTTNIYKCLCIIKAAKSTQKDQVASCLAEIQRPVLLIWGDCDQITPVDVAHQFRDRLHNSSLIVLPDCGHAPMMERPKEFNEALAGFLNFKPI